MTHTAKKRLISGTVLALVLAVLVFLYFGTGSMRRAAIEAVAVQADERPQHDLSVALENDVAAEVPSNSYSRREGAELPSARGPVRLQPATKQALASDVADPPQMESLGPLLSSLRVLIEETDNLLKVAEDCGILTQESQDDVHDWLVEAEDALDSNDPDRVRDNVSLISIALVGVQESLQGSECE